MERYEEGLRACTPVDRLPPRLQANILARARWLDLPPQALIFQAGDSDEFVHFLLSGAAEFLDQGRSRRTLLADSPAAREAMDGPGRKRVSVRALGHAVVAQLPRRALETLVGQVDAGTWTAMPEVEDLGEGRDGHWMVRLLESPLFARLPATTLQQLLDRLEPLDVRAGQVVIEQGDAADYYYLVDRGSCRVSRRINGSQAQVHLADLGPGSRFGEEALIAGRPRNASVAMRTDGRLMRLGAADFRDLLLAATARRVGLDEALGWAAAGATWLDRRLAQDGPRLAAAMSMPLPVLRLRAGRLSADKGYIVCSDDEADGAVATFLLMERAIDAVQLDMSVAELLQRRPELQAEQEGTAPAGQDEETNMDKDQPARPPAQKPDSPGSLLDDMLPLAGDPAAGPEAEDPAAPTAPLADTSTGQQLANLIRELSAQHASLVAASPGPAEPEAAAEPVPPPATPAPAGGDTAAGDGPPSEDLEAAVSAAVASAMAEMEERLLQRLVAALRLHDQRREGAYRERIARMRELTNQEIRQRESALRRKLEGEYAGRESQLREHYEKVMVFANRVAAQRQQMRDARQQLEAKLAAANRLYAEVGEMRQLLTDNIRSLETDADEEMPEFPARP